MTLSHDTLQAAFDAALSTPTMREALGPHWFAVKASLTWNVTRMRRPSRGAAGHCLPWWQGGARMYIHNPRGMTWDMRMVASSRQKSKITLKTSVLSQKAHVLQTLAHEVAHLVPIRPGGAKIAWHSKPFYQTLASLLDDLYPEVNGAFKTSYNGRSWRMYAWDSVAAQLVADALRKREYKAAAKPSVPTLRDGQWYSYVADGRLREFEAAACEQCGEFCIGPNPRTVLSSKRPRVPASLVPAVELGACDALGGIAVCDECFVDEEAPEEAPVAVDAAAVDAALARCHRGLQKAAATALGLADASAIRRMKRPALEALLRGHADRGAVVKALDAALVGAA